MKPATIKTTALLLMATLLLPGCAGGLIVAGAATGVAVAYDRRTAGTVVEDQNIEIKVARAIRRDPQLARRAHISVTSYNNVVLLTGQVPERELRDRAAALARRVEKVRRVHNEITVGPPTDFRARSRDAWLTAKIKSTLLSSKGVRAIHVKVVTEDGVAYLMGLLKRDEADKVARLVQQVEGVKRVVKVFEYID